MTEQISATPDHEEPVEASDDTPFALQEPPIGKPKAERKPTGKRTVSGAWAVYRNVGKEVVTDEIYADEVDALRAVAAGGGKLLMVFLPWGTSAAQMTGAAE
jgi:hypothetical protein